MKLSVRTIQLLKNFANINQSILIRPGNALATMSPSKTVFARATVEESFPKEFAIYDLSKFLSAISLFEDPEFKFKDGHVQIAEGKQSIKYTGADPSFIQAAPAQDITPPDQITKFDMPAGVLINVSKAMNVLQLPEFTIRADGERLSVSSSNEKNSATDMYDNVVGDTDKVFNIVFKAENMKLITADYEVTITKRMGIFKTVDVSYYIACESNSSFED